jgi:hypothetical protein
LIKQSHARAWKPRKEAGREPLPSFFQSPVHSFHPGLASDFHKALDKIFYVLVLNMQGHKIPPTSEL